MRARGASTKTSLRAQAIAGTHVVTIGMNIDKVDTKDLLGFAFHRTDKTEDEAYWMTGVKRFAASDPGFPPGQRVPLNKHPWQSFLWADFTAKENHDYVYRVVAIRGEPEAPKEAEEVKLTISTEPAKGDLHEVYFNRGATASQAYAARFGERSPDDVGQPAFDWLSRGLCEALIGFIDEAKDGGYGLRGALYEFKLDEIIAALRDARQRGADVRIVYDAKENGGKKRPIAQPKTDNEKQIEAYKLKSRCTPRTANKSYIAHNKFLVLMKGSTPVAVWTGSTNITINGVYGHLNVGHVVRDTAVAQAFLDYWNELKGDPEARDLGQWTVENSPAPVTLNKKDMVSVFSPRADMDALTWYGEVMDGAKDAIFITGAFGAPKTFVEPWLRDDDVVRYILLEKAGQAKDAPQTITALRKVPANQVVVAPPRGFALNAFDNWLKERPNAFSRNVEHLHTKFLLVDPLGDDPWVITGSANFSEASTRSNDENMLVIRGNKRVADIYLGEFMRTYNHVSFRAFAASQSKAKLEEMAPLDTTRDWIDRAFVKRSRPALQREYFCP